MNPAVRSPAQIEKGRKYFFWFNALNTVSFQLLSGNIITLYALRLQAGGLLIGTLAAITSLSPVLVLAGRPLVSRMKATTLMGFFWVLRYLLMMPLIVSPALALTGFTRSAVLFLTVSVFGFNIARGIGITTFNPILAELAGRKGRGEYIAFIQLVINVVSPVVGIAMALLLGAEAPMGIYAFFFAVGVLTGFAASYVVFKLPEPVEFASQVSEGMAATIRKAFASRSFSKFIASLSAVVFVTSMAGPFLIVSFKQAYGASDSLAIVSTVIGGLGAIAMALASGLTIDRLGSKPLYFFFFAVAIVSLFPMIASPSMPARALTLLFTGGVFFLFSMGSTGANNAAQTYFFSITSSRENLNLGIIYQIVAGISGAVGALAGGALLERLQGNPGWNAVEVFRVFFGLIAALSIMALVLVSSLENIGAYSIRDFIGIIFSPRDLRALSLLRRLGRSRSMDEEQSVIGALAQSQSEISIDRLLDKLGSPRFIIRSAALNALRYFPVDERVNRALMAQVRDHVFTTAYMAAEILGEKGAKEAVGTLRRGLCSKDYFLSGKCMVSLARLGDRGSLPEIRSILERTRNPRLIIHGAAAMEIFRDAAAVGILLDKMREHGAPQLREELILSIGSILGMEDWFYPIFSEFLEEPGSGVLRLRDYIQAKQSEMKMDYSPLVGLAQNAWGNRKEFAEQAADLLRRLAIRLDQTDISAVLVRSATDRRLMGFPRYRFFLASLAVWFYFETRKT
jgi:MFS family permease